MMNGYHPLTVTLLATLLTVLPVVVTQASAIQPPHPTKGPYHGATWEDQTMAHVYSTTYEGCLASLHEFVVHIWFEPPTANITVDVQTNQTTGTGGYLNVTWIEPGSCSHRLIEVTGVKVEQFATYEIHVDRQLCPCGTG